MQTIAEALVIFWLFMIIMHKKISISKDDMSLIHNDLMV